jgi:hypothetical protein
MTTRHVLCVLFLLAASSAAFSQDKIRWDFNAPAEVAGATNFVSFQVKDGFFIGQTKFDPFLSLKLPTEAIDAARYTFLTLRLYSSTPADLLDVYYSSPNGDWSIGAAFPVRQGWAIYCLDLSKVQWRKLEASSPEAAAWGGREHKVSSLRLDPGNEADREVRIDWAELTGPEGKEHRVLADLPPTAQAALEALAWTFTSEGDFLGWTADNFQQIEVKGGVLRGVTNKFSFLNSPILSLDAVKHPVFTFTAKSNTAGHGSLYFRHVAEALADERAVPFEIQGDGQFHSYTVAVGAHPLWKGIIDQVRFDLLYEPNTQFEIKSCAFVDH